MSTQEDRYSPAKGAQRLASGVENVVGENIKDRIGQRWGELSKFAAAYDVQQLKDGQTSLPYLWLRNHYDKIDTTSSYRYSPKPVVIPLRGGGEIRIGCALDEEQIYKDEVVGHQAGKTTPRLVIGVKTEVPSNSKVTPDGRKEMIMTDLGDFTVDTKTGTIEPLTAERETGDRSVKLEQKQPIVAFLAKFDATKDIDPDRVNEQATPLFVLDMLGYNPDKAREFTATLQKPFTQPGPLERVRDAVRI